MERERTVAGMLARGAIRMCLTRTRVYFQARDIFIRNKTLQSAHGASKPWTIHCADVFMTH